MYAITSEPQYLADQSHAHWDLSFDNVGDPHQEIPRICNDRGWLTLYANNETGEECLYLGRREWAYVPGLPLEESEALLDDLWAYATPADYVVEQNWTPGDVIIWDNRRCLHKRTSIDPSQRRLLLRCQVLAKAGD